MATEDYPARIGDGTDFDDYLKLLANSATGGIYDLARILYEGNPLDIYGNFVGKDFQGLGEYIFDTTPFEDGGGTFFEYDKDAPEWLDTAEDWGRLVGSIGIPIGGILAAPSKGMKAYNMMSKVFPSMKYFQDISRLNQANRYYKYMKNKIEGAPSKLTNFYDTWIKPIGQTVSRPFYRPFFKSTNKADILNKTAKKLHSRAPEINYGKSAATNWALATGAKYGIDGLQYLADRNPEKFDRFMEEFDMSAGAAEPPSYSNYVDPIMKMAKPNRPAIGIQFSDGPTYWG
jgi:hypothetical protein